MALNTIGPSVMIARRHGKWTIRFRLPADVAELYTLPKLRRHTVEVSGEQRKWFRVIRDDAGDDLILNEDFGGTSTTFTHDDP